MDGIGMAASGRGVFEMVPTIGVAAIGALDLLSSLTSSTSQSKAATKQAKTSLFNVGDTSAATSTSAATQTGGCSGALSPQTFNALLPAQDSSSSNASDPLKDLFSQLDGNGDGSISKAEFEDKLGAGGTNVQAADSVFAKMDTDGDGSVSLSEMSSALKGKGGHHHHAGAASAQYNMVNQLTQQPSTASTATSSVSVSA